MNIFEIMVEMTQNTWEWRCP